MNFIKKCFVVLVLILNCSTSKSQQVLINPDIQAEQFMNVQPMAVRIAKCTGDGHLYYITFTGEVFRIDEQQGQLPVDILIATEADHGINYLQGFAMSDSLMFLCGNYKATGVQGHGIVTRGVLQQDGTWVWSNLMTTENYASTANLFDHAFSGICVNPTKDSIIVCSGSRTDHGEIQTSGGMFPGKREVPLTTTIYRLPAMANNLYLYNDSAWLNASGYVFARGFRNAFDVAYKNDGNLFGVENSGDRDDSDELNWIQEGRHYGFPWVMGGNFTGQQSPSYDPATDLLINHGCLAWQNNDFYNDSTYPQMPPGLVITQGLINYGPDADVWRNPATGTVINTSDTTGVVIRTFTSHKSPLGLVFDKNNLLGSNYTGDGFVLGYTLGCTDSSGFVTGYGLSPALDAGEDLLHLKFNFDSLNNDFTLFTTRIASGFKSPVDAEMVDNVLYVIENSYPGSPITPQIWKLTFPLNTSGIDETASNQRIIYPVPSNGVVYMKGGEAGDLITITDLAGNLVQKISNSSNFGKLDLKSIDPGCYLINVVNHGKRVYQGKILMTGL